MIVVFLPKDPEKGISHAARLGEISRTFCLRHKRIFLDLKIFCFIIWKQRYVAPMVKINLDPPLTSAKDSSFLFENML